MKENVPPSIDFAALANSIINNGSIFIVFIIAFVLVLVFYPRIVKRLFDEGGPVSILELKLNLILLSLNIEKDIVDDKLKLSNILHEQANYSKVKYYLKSKSCIAIANNLVGLSGILIVLTSSLLISIILYIMSATKDSFLIEFIIGLIPLIVSSFITLIIKVQYKDINDSLTGFIK